MMRKTLFSTLLLTAALVGAGPLSPVQPTLLDAQYGSISGTVTGIDGKPAATVSVRIMSGGKQTGGLPDNNIGAKSALGGGGDVVMLGRGESTIAVAKTDANGNFKIAKIQTGQFRAVVVYAQAKPASQNVTVEAGKDAVVNFKLEPK